MHLLETSANLCANWPQINNFLRFVLLLSALVWQTLNDWKHWGSYWGNQNSLFPLGSVIIIRLVAWTGYMNQILRCAGLATRECKMALSCPPGTTCCAQEEKCPAKPCNKSFVDQVRSVKMAGYWPMETWPHLGPLTRNKRTLQISSQHVTSRLVNNSEISPHISILWPTPLGIFIKDVQLHHYQTSFRHLSTNNSYFLKNGILFFLSWILNNCYLE